MIKLLIVDDEIHIRTGIRDSTDWERMDIRVCGLADCVPAALDLITLQAPDIVIMDICMPQTSGIELLEIVNDKYPNIRVILISGYREFENARAAVNLNAFAFIAKPIDMDELRAALCRARDEILERRDMLKKEAMIAAKVRENLSLLRDNFLARLVNGKFAVNGETLARAASLELRLEGGSFTVALIVQDGGQQDRKGPEGDESDNLFRAAVMSRLEQVFPKESVYCFNLPAGIGFLSCAPLPDPEAVFGQLDDLIAWINSEAGFNLTVIAARECRRPEDIPKAFKAVAQALDYKMIMGSNQVIHAEQFAKEIQREEAAPINFYGFLHGFEKELLLALKNDNQPTVDAFIGQICDMAETSVAQKQNVPFLLAFFLYQLQMELGIYADSPPMEAEDIYRVIREVGSLPELQEYLTSFFLDIRQDIEKRNQNQRNYLVDRAVKYIEQNLHEQISLVDAADRLRIHPSYLSKIFKSVTDKSFTDYVSQAKMEEAKRLLQTTAMRVYEISELLDYHDPGYFIKLFKKVYGVSPGEYRQL